MAELRILADQNIPCVEQAFGRLGTVQTRAGHDIGSSEVQGADVLLVRSVARIDAALLEKSNVQFVGSATTGTDHVDQAYLRDRGIQFAHAPGSNASSVADYVVAALLELARRSDVSLQDRTVGIVGCGSIGGRLARRLPALGLNVLRNDPPRAEAAEAKGASHNFVGLARILEEVDILTLHVPLKTGGAHPTYHLVDAEVLKRLPSGAWLLNTSRGRVVDGAALLDAREQGPLGAAVLDVWEHEPAPDPALIEVVDVATPHIAGYAYDGKVRGTYMLYRALCNHLGVEPQWDPTSVLPSDKTDGLWCGPPDPRLPPTDWLRSLTQQAYNLRVDDASMRRLLDVAPDERADAFTQLRSSHRQRREFQQHRVPQAGIPAEKRRAVEEGLTFQLR